MNAAAIEEREIMTGELPYANGTEMLASLCQALDQRLAQLVEEMPAGRQPSEDFHLRGLVITDTEARDLLARHTEGWGDGFEAGSLWQTAEPRIAASRAAGIPLPL